jgi:diadenosine tetraphosphate (Ap4A) HIT family hydrolase
MNWDALAAGDGCMFDAPRPDHTEHWDAVATLAAATLYLPKDQTYRGHCILVFDPRHAIRPDQLTAGEWAAFTADLHRAVTAVMWVCKPDHINIASLGNVVPHLHWHVVPRYKTDPRWGGPIWTADAADAAPRHLPAAERAELLARLRDELR